jgi:hypothetical protein
MAYFPYVFSLETDLIYLFYKQKQATEKYPELVVSFA